MCYQLMQEVPLWQIASDEPQNGKIHILKEVVVTITDIRSNVPDEETGLPVSAPSLRGISSEGEIFEKHWDTWPPPEGNNDFTDRWTKRQDGVGDQPEWEPREAITLYNRFSRRKAAGGDPVQIVNALSEVDMKPQGDVDYCSTHDRYFCKDDHCPLCGGGAK